MSRSFQRSKSNSTIPRTCCSLTRRSFGRMLLAAPLLPSLMLPVNTAANDYAEVKSNFVWMLERTPERHGEGEDSFPVTSFLDSELADQWVPESATTATPFADPNEVLNDWRLFFGFSSGVIVRHLVQNDANGFLLILQVHANDIDPREVSAVWEAHGFVARATDQPMWSFAGDEATRQNLASRSPEFKEGITSGWFDHISFVDDATLVIASEAELVERVHLSNRRRVPLMYFTRGVDSLRRLIPVGAYRALLVPGHYLQAGVDPVSQPKILLRGACAGESAPDEHSAVQGRFAYVAVALDQHEQVDLYEQQVQERLTRAVSSSTGVPYADFLTVTNVEKEHVAIRFDIEIDTDVPFLMDEALRDDDLAFLKE